MSDINEALKSPNVQAFLRVLRAGESSQDDVAYRTMYGGGTFASFQDHPRIKNTAAGITSTAAGAYQFLEKTWNGLDAQYNFPDFSPATQDFAAVALILGRGALDDVLAGRFEQAIRKCNKEWASLPWSPYGQPTRTIEQARAVYEAYGGKYSEGTVDTAQPTKESKMVPLPIIGLALQAIAAFMPKVRELFPGSEVSERNLKAAEAVVNIAKDAIGAANEQDLITKLKEDPQAANVVEKAVQDNWFGIVEVGGGIVEARKAALEMTKAEVSLWKNPAFIISFMLLIPVYAVIGSVIGFFGDTSVMLWDDNVRMLVVGIISNVVSGTMGFWLGSSFGSQKKSDSFVK
jgi:muramidase (phage lysozyme)